VWVAFKDGRRAEGVVTGCFASPGSGVGGNHLEVTADDRDDRGVGVLRTWIFCACGCEGLFGRPSSWTVNFSLGGTTGNFPGKLPVFHCRGSDSGIIGPT
jgi:hypothetical protein